MGWGTNYLEFEWVAGQTTWNSSGLRDELLLVLSGLGDKLLGN